VELTKGLVRRIAIVGLGSIGSKHMNVLRELRPEIQVIAVRSGKKPDSNKGSGAFHTVGSIEQALIIGVDAAIISTPAPFHLTQAAKFIAASVPLLIEKPICSNIDEARDFRDSIKKLELPILIGYLLRHSPGAATFINIAQALVAKLY
jgi:predicted dehydrogenase